MSSRRLQRRLTVTVAAALAGLAAVAGPASAGPLVASAPDCDAQALSRPFTPWLDYAQYTPLPGASFEDGAAGWSMGAGAGVAAGTSPFGVAGDDGSRSLSLPAGSFATSPSICVGLEHPTLRFFARRRSGDLLATLRVDVRFEDALGQVQSLPIGAVSSAGTWQPTLPMAVVANLLALLPGEHTPVAFRFTPQGGDWSVDDVYVDPYGRK